MHAHPFIRTNCRKQRVRATECRGVSWIFTGVEGTVKVVSYGRREPRSASRDWPRATTSFCSNYRSVEARFSAWASLFHGCHGCVHVTRHCQYVPGVTFQSPCTDKHASRSRYEIGGRGEDLDEIRWKSSPNVNVSRNRGGRDWSSGQFDNPFRFFFPF